MNIRCLFLPCKWVHIADTTDCGIWQCLYCKTVSRGRKKDKAGYVDQDPNPGRWKTKAERDKLAARVRMLGEAILRHQGANDVITLIDKDLYAAPKEENR